MRIGVIAPPWFKVPPDRYGGTENVIAGLCLGLQALGHSVVLAASTGSRCPVPTVHIKVGHYDQMGSAIEAAYCIQAYDELAGNACVDVIHDHTQIGFFVGDTRGVPVLTTNHNLFDAGRVRIYREAVRRGVGVVAISNHHASTADLPLAGVVYNGIDVANVPVGAGKGSSFHPGPYVCALSRFSPTKGIEQAIVIAKEAGIPLLIAAKVPQTSAELAYFEKIRPMLNGNADYIGEVSAKEKYELMGGATALLNPIQWDEPFGMAMAESLACGTPVIATRRGAAPEIVAHGTTGLMAVQWERLGEELASVLEGATTLDRWWCRHEAERRFDISTMASRYVDLYSKMEVSDGRVSGVPGLVRV